MDYLKWIRLNVVWGLVNVLLLEMKLPYSSFLFFILFVSNLLMAQKENAIWYFGDRAGLDFNTIPPTPITSNLTTLEGTSSICDPGGHLLFYTNGASVWDRNHS